MSEPTDAPPVATEAPPAATLNPLNDVAASLVEQGNQGGEDDEPQFLKMLRGIPANAEPTNDDAPGEVKPEPEPTKPAKKGPKEYPEIKIDDIPDEAPAGSTEKQKIHWGHMKQASKAAEAKAAEAEAKAVAAEAKHAEYETKLAALEGRIPDLEKKATFVDEAEKKIAILDVRNSREYKAVVDVPLEAMENQIVEVAKEYEIDPTEIAKAINEPDRRKRAKALDEITTGMTQADKDDIHQMARDAHEIFGKRDKMLERATEAKAQLDKITAEKDAAAKSDFKKNYGDKVETVVTDMKARIPFVKIEETDTPEAVFDAIKASALASDFQAADPKSQAAAAVSAFMVPRMAAQTRHLIKQLAERDARIAQFLAAKPGAGSETRHTGAEEELPANWRPGMPR